MRPRVHTEKHIQQRSIFIIANGAINTTNIATAVAAPSGTVVAEVREGCTISAVYIEMWLTGDDVLTSSAIVSLEKRVAGVAAMAAGDAAALNVYPNKKNLFHVQMGLVPSKDQNPMASIKGWFKIPRGKQRFSLGDSLVLNIFAQSDGITGCGFMLYKEQY